MRPLKNSEIFSNLQRFRDALKPGNKAEEMFEHIQSFWNNSLEEFDLKVTENFRIAPSDNHNEGNELFLIDSDNETEKN